MCKFFVPLLLVLLQIANPLFSQNQTEIDSLEQLLHSAQSDSASIILLNDLSSKYRWSNFEKAVDYALRALELSKKTSNKLHFARSSWNIATVYIVHSQYDKALSHTKNALEAYISLNDSLGISYCYNNLGIIYRNQGHFPLALDYYQKSLVIKEKYNDKRGAASCYLNIGNIHLIQHQYEQALVYYNKALDIDKEAGDKAGMSFNYINMGNIFMTQKNYDRALKYYQNSLAIDEELKDESGMASNYLNIGSVFSRQGKFDLALQYLNKSLAIYVKLEDKSGIGWNYKEMGLIALTENRINEGYKFSKKAYTLALEIGEAQLIKESAEVYAISSRKLGLYKEAFDAHVVFKNMNDSLYNEENIKKITATEYQYKYEKDKQKQELEKQKQQAVYQLEMKRQQAVRNWFIGAFSLALLLAFFIYRSYRIKRDSNEILFKQKEQILDSIYYAKKIQDAVLPSQQILDETLPDHFIFFKPRDIVSGDFYWVKKIEQKLVVAAADCTGHGVPGAFMSMLGISFLNEIVKPNIQSSGQILNELRHKVKNALKQEGKNEEQKDGMDMALCIIDLETAKMQFSGAYNSLLLITERKGWKDRIEDKNYKTVDAEKNILVEIKADRQPVAVGVKEKEFSTQEIQLKKEDVFYLFSDGYIDQFGGEQGRKFMMKNFKQFLLSIHEKTMNEQFTLLEKNINSWMQDLEQVDDILVIGIKI